MAGARARVGAACSPSQQYWVQAALGQSCVHVGFGSGLHSERKADVAREVSGALDWTVFLTSGLGDTGSATSGSASCLAYPCAWHATAGLGALCRGACEDPILRPGASAVQPV